MNKKVYQNGDIFYGHQKNNHKDGIGIFIRQNTLVYIGYWKDSNPVGKGLLVDKDLIIFQDTINNLYFEQSTKDEFINCFYKRKPHKQLEGIFKFNNKIIKGNILCNKRPLMCSQFSGFFEMRNNHKIYKGFFKNDNLQKVGQINSSQGLFIGNFINNKKNGFGIQELFLEKQNIIRKYKDNEPLDDCILVCKEMFCIQIMEQGIQSGIICYQDGSIYFGQLIKKRDSNLFQRHGFGCYYEDNRYFLGEWSYNQRQGLGYEVRYAYNNNDQSRVYQNYQQTQSEVINFLTEYSQIYKQYYQQFVSVEKFFKNKDKDYKIETEFIGQWNKGLKNGEGIFQSYVNEVNGIWRNGQLIKKSEQKNFEYLNQFEKKDFYQQGQIYVLKLLTKITQYKKECYSHLEKIIQRYQKNQKFLRNLSYNENDLIAKKQLLQEELNELAFKISKKCDDVQIKKILLDPFNYIQIKEQDKNTQTLYDKLMTSLVEKQQGQKNQQEFLNTIKKDTNVRQTIFKKLNSFYNNLQNSNAPKITFQQNNMLNELYTEMNIKSNNKQDLPQQNVENQLQQADTKDIKEFNEYTRNSKTLLKRQTTEKMSKVEIMTPLNEPSSQKEQPSSFQIIQNESQVQKLDRVDFKTFEIGEMTPSGVQKKNNQEKPFDPFSSGSDEEDSNNENQQQQQDGEKPFDPFSSGSDVEDSNNDQQQSQQNQQDENQQHPFLSDVDEDQQDENQPHPFLSDVDEDQQDENQPHPFLSEDENIPVQDNNQMQSKETIKKQDTKKNNTIQDMDFQEVNDQFLSQQSQAKNNQQTQNFNLQELDNNFLSDDNTQEEQAHVDNMTTQEQHNFFNITTKNSNANQDQNIKVSSTKKNLEIIAVDSAEDIEDEQSQKQNLNVIAVDSMEDFNETVQDKGLNVQPVDSEILDQPTQNNTEEDIIIKKKSTNTAIKSKQVDSQIQEELDNINSEDSQKIIDISVEEQKQRMKEENEKTLIKNQTMIDEYLPKFSSLNQSQQVHANLKKQSDNEPDYFNEFSSLDDHNI